MSLTVGTDETRGLLRRSASSEVSSRTSAGPDILDAVADQRGGHWIRFGTADRFCWFSLQELQKEPGSVFSRLSGPGMTYLTSQSQNGFKKLIEQHSCYRDGLVSAHQGWIGDHYVFGNGEVASPTANNEQVIIAFETDEKFAARGSLDGWIDAVHPLVREQRLPLFALAYAFIGPLMRFAPPEMLNPVARQSGWELRDNQDGNPAAQRCDDRGVGCRAQEVLAF